MAASIPMMRHLFKSFRRDNNVPATATTSATITIGTARCNPIGINHFTMSDSTAGSRGWRLAATNSGHDGDIDANTKSGTAERRNWNQQQASQLPSIEKTPPADG